MVMVLRRNGCVGVREGDCVYEVEVVYFLLVCIHGYFVYIESCVLYYTSDVEILCTRDGFTLTEGIRDEIYSAQYKEVSNRTSTVNTPTTDPTPIPIQTHHIISYPDSIQTPVIVTLPNVNF